MFEVSQTNKHLWMEICFWKTSREASEIVDGYGTQASSKKQKASYWCEEDEEKLTRVFHQLQEMQAKSLQRSRAVGDFYGTGIEIWAGFGPVRQLLRPVFSCFHGQIFFLKPLQMVKTFLAKNEVKKNRPQKLPNRPKSSPNLNSCSIKISHRATSL